MNLNKSVMLFTCAYQPKQQTAYVKITYKSQILGLYPFSHFHFSSHCLTFTPAKTFSHNSSKMSAVFVCFCFVSSQLQG